MLCDFCREVHCDAMRCARAVIERAVLLVRSAFLQKAAARAEHTPRAQPGSEHKDQFDSLKSKDIPCVGLYLHPRLPSTKCVQRVANTDSKSRSVSLASRPEGSPGPWPSPGRPLLRLASSSLDACFLSAPGGAGNGPPKFGDLARVWHARCRLHRCVFT